MKDTLAYSYRATAAILAASGYNDDYIIDFLTKHQNESGYIRSDLIPATKTKERKPNAY